MRPSVAAGRLVTDLASSVRAQPELAVAILVGLVVAAGSVLLFYRLQRPTGVRFKRILAERDAVTVLMHPNPDPDAMAAAVGVAALAEQVDTDVVIQFPGQIRHQENRAFRTVLDLELEKIENVTELAHEDVILVDHNEPRGFSGAAGVLPAAVIDHHPGNGTGELFTDVRTEYGACASIVAEYFADIKATPVPPEMHASEAGSTYTVPSLVSTGLMYGILADTKHLTVGAASADFNAAAYLRPGVDEDKLDRIANPAVDADVLEVKARAIAGRRIKGSFAVSDVGRVNNPDAIPQAADELIRLEGVTAVVVCGERGDVVYMSGRSRDDRVHMGRTLESAVEGIPNASAGGHARMGGGQIRAQPQLTDGGTPGSPNFARNDFSDRLFDCMAGDV